jgi:hypothetical protein
MLRWLCVQAPEPAGRREPGARPFQTDYKGHGYNGLRCLEHQKQEAYACFLTRSVRETNVGARGT